MPSRKINDHAQATLPDLRMDLVHLQENQEEVGSKA
jgi:hypothetical protein